ncbi:MAG: Gfo/Idh/MocA family oxidoreductase [Nitrospirae bacterium]|nr:MAG: Gfo/Idh/MocA family oxidoreductase [Nitrospirota bacterium]
MSHYKEAAIPVAAAQPQESRQAGTGRTRAAIIGLGQIGNQFDDDPKRTEIWTHAGAYLAVPEVGLVAGADPDADRLHRFVKGRRVSNGYRDYREMLRSETIDLLSICSPTAFHHEMVLEGVKAGVKAIFCEKPLAATVEQAMDMVEACESAGVVLAVNHSRRWEAIYIHAKRLLAQGEIGVLKSIVGHYPGKVFTMGTHLFDLMRFYAGNVEWACGDATDHGEGELNLSGYLHFRSSVQGTVVSGWDRANHLFELELLGSRGRICLFGDGDRLEVSRFEDSPRYSGYRELSQAQAEDPALLHGENRLVVAVKDIVRCVQSDKVPACSGRDGLAALEVAWALCESATRGHTRIEFPLYRSLSQWR